MYKWRAGTTPGGTFHRRMHSPVIKMNSPAYLARRAASARRRAQIASAKARRAKALLTMASFRRRTNLVAKFKRAK